MMIQAASQLFSTVPGPWFTFIESEGMCRGHCGEVRGLTLNRLGGATCAQEEGGGKYVTPTSYLNFREDQNEPSHILVRTH